MKHSIARNHNTPIYLEARHLYTDLLRPKTFRPFRPQDNWASKHSGNCRDHYPPKANEIAIKSMFLSSV